MFSIIYLFVFVPNSTAILLLMYSKLRAKAMFYIGIPVLIIANHVSITIVPGFIVVINGGSWDPWLLRGHLYVLILDCLFALIVSTILCFVKLRHAKKEIERHEKYKKIRDDILEDGKVTGPGKYVRHKSWGGGTGSMTDGSTKGVKNPGWHGTPWA